MNLQSINQQASPSNPFDPNLWTVPVHREGWLRCSAERQPNGALRVRGAFAIPASHPGKFVATVNGQPAQNASYGLPGDPIFNYRGYEPPTGGPGFEFDIPADQAPPFRISVTDEAGNRLCKWWHDWVYLPETGIPYPGADLQKRNNSTNDHWYHHGGGTFAAKLIDAIRTFDGRDPSDFKTIVDWGCGTGRVTRHLPKMFPEAHVIGVDIDSAAIQWAEDETPLINFHVSEPHPPMPVAGGMTDLLVSHSVFSHLPEADQFKWLADLDRVMKPGGLLLVTTLSELAPFILPVPATARTQLMSGGFTCFDTDLEEVTHLEIKEGYSVRRLAYQSHDYIRREWGRFFEVVDILDGYADFLAMVVLRAR
ncbi:class I SAM-dependent methyltransferase [Rhodopseudomonas sp.]|uniref:class I SAM-dependent methyltransferase n=1 Tax=Rhodopseudomonas sp. TaxID=1078 RepID=UPI003B3B8EEE